MNAQKRAQCGSWALAAVVALALPMRGWAQAGDSQPQAQEEKSAEDILNISAYLASLTPFLTRNAADAA